MSEGGGDALYLFRAVLCGPVWRTLRVLVEVEPREGETVAETYARAAAACQAVLRPVAAAWEREVAERRAAAERELEEYYRRCLEEEVSGLHRMFHRVAVLSVRVSLARRTVTRRQFRHDLHQAERELCAEVAGKEQQAGRFAAELRRRRAELERRFAAWTAVRLEAVAQRKP